MIQNLQTLLVRSALRVKSILSREDGVTLVEYALLLALIAIVCIAAITLIGGNANNVLSTAAHSL
jgi:pilus assembly protein Flp/PilA